MHVTIGGDVIAHASCTLCVHVITMDLSRKHALTNVNASMPWEDL